MPKKTAAVESQEPKPLSVAQKLEAVGIDAICERVANCHFLQNIADDCDVSRGSLVKWLTSGEGAGSNADLYARAREAQADRMAEDILQIADDGKSDTYIDSEGRTRTDQDVIARSRLRVDARKWLAAKMAPKKYGEKLAIGGADDLPPIKTMTDDELNAKIAAKMAALSQDDGE